MPKVPGNSPKPWHQARPVYRTEEGPTGKRKILAWVQTVRLPGGELAEADSPAGKAELARRRLYRKAKARP